MGEAIITVGKSSTSITIINNTGVAVPLVTGNYGDAKFSVSASITIIKLS